MQADGEQARDARALLLTDAIWLAYVDACALAAIAPEREDSTRLDEWDAAAGVLDAALAVACELHGAQQLGRALQAIAAVLVEADQHSSETVLNMLDNVRHGYPPLGGGQRRPLRDAAVR